jgi:hypothetical protein
VPATGFLLPSLLTADLVAPVASGLVPGLLRG